MKAFAFFVLLVAGVCAEPIRIVHSPAIPSDVVVEKNLIIDIIQAILQSVFGALQASDPYVVDSWGASTEILGIVPVGISIHGAEIAGFGNVNIRSLSYADNEITFDVEFPHVSVGAANLHAYLAGAAVDIGGSISFDGFGLRIRIDIVPGSGVGDVEVALSLGGIHSDVHAIILGNDYSTLVNEYISNRIPGWLIANGGRINQILSLIVEAILDAALS